MNNYNNFDTFNNMFLMQNNLSNNMYGPYEGYLKGNMFSNLYSEYKNYKPNNLKISNEKEEALFNLNQICFAMHEMNLYLDLHPEDRKIQQLFNDYRKMFIDLEKKYESEYGPLTTCSEALEKSPFEWVTDSFPWEDDINV